jgi:DNA-binding LacI/PurR family transcriptional regulator
MKRPPTHADIARHAGVSTASVSRALAGEKGVGPEVTERVRRSAASLGYRGNRAARALRRRQADAIGLLVPDVENPFFASIARAVEDFAIGHEYAVLLCNTEESPRLERRYVDLMVGESVAGVIAVPAREEPGPLVELRDAGIPVVVLDRRVDDDAFDTVLVDHRAGARELVEHLIGHRHDHVASISVDTPATSGRDRMRGCHDAVAAHAGVRLTSLEGRPEDAVGVARTFELAGRLARQLLERPDPPGAIFCTNNLLALGALRGLRAGGLRVPDDIALAAFDDELFYELLDPPLTGVAQPIEELARTAAELLYARITEPLRPTRVVVLPTQLRLRRSCGCDGPAHRHE